MSDDSLDEMKQEANDLGALSPAVKMYSTILNAPLNFKKGMLYIIPLYVSLMIGAPNNGFRETATIYALSYLASILILPLVRGKKSKILKAIHVLVAIAFILSLAFIGVMFFALLVVFIDSILNRLGAPEGSAPFVVAILCYVVMKIYKKHHKKKGQI